MLYLYILKNCSKGTYYIGTTINIERRLIEHNRQNNHFTGKIGGNWKLIFSKLFEKETEARKEEIRLKRCKNRKYLDWYVNNCGIVAQR